MIVREKVENKVLWFPDKCANDKLKDSDPDVSAKDVGDFMFCLDDPVVTLPADELFSNGQLVSLQLLMVYPVMTSAAMPTYMELHRRPTHFGNENTCIGRLVRDATERTTAVLVRNEVGRWWRSRVPRRRRDCHLLLQANGGGAGLPATLLLSMAAIDVLCCVTMCRTVGLCLFEEDDD
nr:uncharacterized protein LOC109178225 [Ipomoea trifida]